MEFPRSVGDASDSQSEMGQKNWAQKVQLIHDMWLTHLQRMLARSPLRRMRRDEADN